ncbi:MAG: hypothetical protein KIT11_05410 [Fimbriimonadaceae bacterium]|nr:hypothetical protein [Fimbriimonadaceae bacterium]QYK56670.1 MAG: hypothetical protein KF733_04110 [Fimbriimonadaceae bacterium]
MAEVRLRIDRFDLAKSGVRKGLDGAVRALASECQARAIDNIGAYPEARRPIDTGAMQASIYVETADSSERQEALARAAEQYATASRAEAPPEGAASPRPADLEAKVAVGVEYGVYVEQGTPKMAARPFLEPALASLEAETERVVKEAVAEALREVL